MQHTFSSVGVEKNNDDSRWNYLSNRWDACGDMLRTEIRLEKLLSTCQQKKRKYEEWCRITAHKHYTSTTLLSKKNFFEISLFNVYTVLLSFVVALWWPFYVPSKLYWKINFTSISKFIKHLVPIIGKSFSLNVIQIILTSLAPCCCFSFENSKQICLNL